MRNSNKDFNNLGIASKEEKEIENKINSGAAFESIESDINENERLTEDEKKILVSNIKEKYKHPGFERKFKQYLWITIGVIIMDLGFFFFLDPAGLVVGGMNGLAIILYPLYSKLGSFFTPSIFLFIVDAIALIIGGIFLGKDFFLKTLYGSLLVPGVLFILEKLPLDSYYFINSIDKNANGEITFAVKIISLLFGVVLQAIGVGVALKNNGSTGGMDVYQKILSKYLNIPLSKTMYFTDMVIVLVAGFVDLDSSNRVFETQYHIANVAYGIIGVYAIGFIVDMICLSLMGKRILYIITDKPDVIKEIIYKDLDRGVTISKVYGGYSNKERNMLICVMNKSECYRIMDLIKSADPRVFTFVAPCQEVRGEYAHRRLF